MFNENQFKQQLCWTCQKCIGGCSWSKYGNPVDGWGAEKIQKTRSKDEGWYIYSCPEYLEDEK